MAISPDGQQLAYIASDARNAVLPGNQAPPRYIWLKPIGGGAARVLPVTDLPSGILDLAFSPDGQSLAFRTSGELSRVTVRGGRATTICQAENAYGVSWGADDRIVFSVGRSIMRVAAAGGSPEPLVTLEGYVFASNAEVLALSGAVLYTLHPLNLTERSQIVVQRPGATVRTILAHPGYDARYIAATGQIIYENQGTLFAVPFDSRELRATGPPVAVIEGVTETPWSSRGYFGVSANGTLIYATGRHGWRDAVLVGRDGTRRTVGRFTGTTAAARVSPDGTQVAFDGEGHIWVAELGNTASVRRLSAGDFDHAPVWTPDGQRIAFARFAFGDDAESIYWQRADGGDQAELLIHRAAEPESWSAATGRLSFLRIAGDLRSIWSYGPKDGTSRLHRYVAPPSSRPASAFSPNGKWLAYEDAGVDASGRVQSQVYIESASTPSERVKVTNATGGRPAWSPDGRELFFDDGTRLFSVAVHESAAGAAPAFGERLPLPITGFLQRGGDIGYDAAERGYDVMPDGKAFLMMFQAPAELRVIPNWTARGGSQR